MSDGGTRAAAAAAAHHYSIHVYDHTGHLIGAPMPLIAADDETAVAWANAHLKGLDIEVMDGERRVYCVRGPKPDSASS